jgi:hypothetical protein
LNVVALDLAQRQGSGFTFIGLGREVLEGEHGALLLDGGVDLVDNLHLVPSSKEGLIVGWGLASEQSRTTSAWANARNPEGPLFLSVSRSIPVFLAHFPRHFVFHLNDKK